MDVKEYNRLEIAIDKLTLIATNLDKLLSVHEERLKQQGNKIEQLELTLEKRREIYENTFSNVYDKMREDDKGVIDEYNAGLEKVNNKVNKIEKTQVLYIGGFAVITFLLTYGQSFIKLFITATAK